MYQSSERLYTTSTRMLVFGMEIFVKSHYVIFTNRSSENDREIALFRNDSKLGVWAQLPAVRQPRGLDARALRKVAKIFKMFKYLLLSCMFLFLFSRSLQRNNLLFVGDNCEGKFFYLEKTGSVSCKLY